MSSGDEECQPIVWWHPLVSLGAIAALNGFVVLGAAWRSPGLAFVRLMMGPFSAWLDIQIHDDMELPWGVVAASFAAVLPLVIYAARGTRAGLVVGSILWWLAGYLFCVAIWI